MAGRLDDPRGAAACPGAPALHDRAFVDVGLRDDQLVAVEIVVGLGVRDSRAQHLVDVARGCARCEGENGPRLRHGAAADVVRDQASLSGRYPHPARDGAHLLPLGGRHQRFTSVLRSPEWARKVRVGANSPSLWPTICSVTKTGTCLRPSWTAIVWPTISGKTVDERDHVRIIRFSFAVFIASMRLSSRSSTNGPFFDDLLTSASPCRAAWRGRSTCRTACASAAFACRASARPRA